MAVFYNEGETKKRPGVYQRHANTGNNAISGAQDGICAIGIQGSWGPLATVVKCKSIADLRKNFGSGAYSSTFTVPAAEEMFNGGASVVYAYRMGTGGTAASKTIDTSLVVTAKYVGTQPISISVNVKLGDSTKKEFKVYFGTTLVETIEFSGAGSGEGASLVSAAAVSEYVTVAVASGETAPATVSVLAVASGALTGGANPTVTNASYSAAWAALEPYYYNTIALDVDDDASVTLSLLLQSYLDNAYTLGKLAIAVVGEKTTVAFATRKTHSAAFNDAKFVYLGGGYKAGSVNKDGVMAICYLAGVIASTPSNKSITHANISGATDLCESLTYAQYEEAIDAGMLMVSMSPDGSIWYDTGINTLINPDSGTQDDGWKKIRRVKTRFELIERLDRALNPKVGRVTADTDGIADVVQTGQRVVDALATEGKIYAGGKFIEDPEHPHSADSAWFIIQVVDLDSLEKIYLTYNFKYSQNS